MANEKMTVVFAGGGTGGHLFPGIAIADELKKRRHDISIIFIGTKDKIEAWVVPQRGYNFAPIWISGFRRKSTLSNLLFPIKVVVALAQSLFLMKKLKPDVVVGTGGYVCGPPLYVATWLGIPTLIQEQNSFPGVTTRKLSPRVDEVHITFESSKQYLKRLDNVKLSGNPTSAKLENVTREEAAEYFNLNPSPTTLLVFGGSLGATSINREIEKILPALFELDVQLIWQTGAGDFDRVSQSVSKSAARNAEQRIRVLKFIEHMEFAYAASDLAICRAGASTLAELMVVGLPSVLVPYPFAAADHQTENAKALVAAGAAVMIKDSDIRQQLLPTIKSLLADADKLQLMSREAKKLGKPEAASTIAQAVLRLATRN